MNFVSSATHRHSQVTDLLYSIKGSKSFFYLWPQKLYIALRFGTHTCIASVLTRTDFCHGWAIYCSLVAANTLKGDLSRAPHQRKGFLELFSTRFQIWTWNLAYTSNRWLDTPQSGLVHPLANQKFISYIWPHQLYESPAFGTYMHKVSLLAPYRLIVRVGPEGGTIVYMPLVSCPWRFFNNFF